MKNYEDFFEKDGLFGESIPFAFHSYKDYPEISETVKEIWSEFETLIPIGIQGRSIYKAREHLKTILCNLFIAKIMNKCLAVPRDNNLYTKTQRFGKYHVNQKMFLMVLDYLVNKGYAGCKPGFKGPQNGFCSRYWSLPRLYGLFTDWKPDNIEILHVETKLVILRNDDKQDIGYRKNSYTEDRTKKLTLINKVYARNNFTAYLKTVDDANRLTRLYPRLVSIHNGSSFQLGGRLYNISTRGLSYQQFNKDARKQIRIGMEETVERDFASFHIGMLYSERNLQLDKPGYGFASEELRPVAKKFLLVLINSKSERTAIAAMNEEKYKLSKSALRTVEEAEYLKLLQETDFKHLLRQAKEYHAPIRELFCSGAGLRLQNKDARIALDIVYDFASRGIPVLPVHDSFIIGKRYDEELMTVMQDAYRRHCNGYTCKIS